MGFSGQYEFGQSSCLTSRVIEGAGLFRLSNVVDGRILIGLSQVNKDPIVIGIGHGRDVTEASIY